MPKPTADFLNKKHYRNIFFLINLWFSNERVSMPQNTEIVNFPNASIIYEYYCLFNILNIINDIGFKEDLDKRDCYNYEANINNPNTFYFYDKNINITLYYEPKIYYEHFENDLFLMRVDKNFYKPDFVIKKTI